MAIKAGFLPPLKDRGRFSNSGQVFYDNQGTYLCGSDEADPQDGQGLSGARETPQLNSYENHTKALMLYSRRT